MVSGKIPDGDFGEDTTIYYCCRSDGNQADHVTLPTVEAFYLLRHKKNCQQVQTYCNINFDCIMGINIFIMPLGFHLGKTYLEYRNAHCPGAFPFII